MKAIIFARVSTKDQEEGHSLDAQISQALNYAIENNLQIIKQYKIIKIIESSTKGKRPEFAKMIDFIRTQKEKIVVLAYNTDRLQRDFDEQSLELKSLVNQNKAEIHFTSTRQKMTSESDSSAKFRYGLDVLLANDYTNRISENVKRSIKKKLEEGTILGDSPLGYINKARVDKKKEKVDVIIDNERVGLVKQIFQEYASGQYSMSEIQAMFHTQGLRTKNNNKVSKSQVERMLKNPFYYGYMEYKGVLYKHIHPRLISKDLFDECQAIRQGRKPTKYRKTQKPFILKGLLKCSHCNCSYSPELKKEKYVYMRPTKSQGECSYCFHINENKILSQIEEVLKKLTIPENILLQLNEELKDSSNAEHKNQMEEIKKLKTQYSTLQTKMKRARDFLLDFTITKEEYEEITMDLQVQKANTEHRIKVLSKADNEFNKSLGTIFILLSKAHQLFKSSEIEEKRRIITIMFPNLLLDRETLLITPRKPFDLFLNQEGCPEWLLGRDSNPRPID
jgi:site-specific DNA recombinase